MIALRASSDTLKYGDFAPVYAKAGVIAYTRVLGAEQYLVILNFSKKPAQAELELIAPAVNDPDRSAPDATVVISNTGRKTYDGSLEPWEAVALKIVDTD